MGKQRKNDAYSLRKADILLISVIVLVSVFTTFFIITGENDKGDTVEIYVNNKIYGEYSMSEPQEIEVKNGNKVNIVKIDDKGVRVKHSNCKNNNCVNQGYITSKGSNIVCIPNRVLIKVKGEGEIDSISK